MPLSKFASLQGPGQSKFANLQFFSRKILLKSSFTFQSWPSLQVCKFAPIFWARFASLQVCKFKGGGIYFDQDLISQVFEFASFGRQNLDANHGYRLNFVSQNLKTCKLAAGANLQTCSVCKLANLQTCFIHNFANLQTCSWVQTCKLAMSANLETCKLALAWKTLKHGTEKELVETQWCNSTLVGRGCRGAGREAASASNSSRALASSAWRAVRKLISCER